MKLTNIVNFLFEVGHLSKTPRTGFFFLGGGYHSVAEHCHRVAYISYILGHMAQADTDKLIKMGLFHDLAEGRTGDQNYVSKKYVELDEEKVMDEISRSFPFGGEILDLYKEYEEKKTLEAKLAKDADQLELLMTLKEQMDLGNKRAKLWTISGLKRIKTKEGKALAQVIMKTPADSWWVGDYNNSWWVNPTKKAIRDKD